MAKKNHNFEWISFAIWTFSIIEEIASGYFYTWIQIVSRLDWLRGGGSLFYYGDHKVDYFHQDATWKALESMPSEKIIDGLRWKGGVGLMEFSSDIKMSQICRSEVCTANPFPVMTTGISLCTNSHREFPVMNTGSLQWEQGFHVMKTGFSLWELVHTLF